MSWQDEALPVFRVLIGDDEAPYTYCDTRLSDILMATAKLLVFELSFANCYTVSISTYVISPDPSDDPFFIPLLCLKAASKVASSEYRAASLNAGSVTDGPSSINLGDSATALKARMDALEKDYQQAKLQYAVGNAIGCQAVLSSCKDIYSKCYSDGYFNYNSFYRIP